MIFGQSIISLPYPMNEFIAVVDDEPDIVDLITLYRVGHKLEA